MAKKLERCTLFFWSDLPLPFYILTRMAMLAEPRRKQRIGPNPRGKFFLEDEDNKGRTMLQKLGWQSGDGLGRQNQGMSNPLCPKIQMDSKGLGYDVNSDPWVAHNEEFAAVLENLQAINEIDSNGASNLQAKPGPDSDEESRARKLEKMSKSSRARIHYHKFVKNKDVSNFSNTDLKCIFGKDGENLAPKTKKKKRTEQVEDEASVPLNSSGDAVPEKSFDEDGVKTINRGSMADYFRTLMAQKTNGVRKTDSIDPKPDCADDAVEDADEILKEKKKKKRVKEEIKSHVEVEQQPVDMSEILIETNEKTEKKKRKKKKKGVENDDDGQLQQIVQSEPIALETIIDETVEKKKRKKKKKDLANVMDVHQSIVEAPTVLEISAESAAAETKEKKQRKRKKNVDDDDQCEVIVESEPIVVEKEKKRRKKDKLARQQEVTDCGNGQLNEKKSDTPSQMGTAVESTVQQQRTTVVEQSISKKYKIGSDDLKKIAEQFRGANLLKIAGYGPY